MTVLQACEGPSEGFGVFGVTGHRLTTRSCSLCQGSSAIAAAEPLRGCLKA